MIQTATRTRSGAGPQRAPAGLSASDSLRDERMADLLAREAGTAIVEACGGSSKIAEAAGLEDARQARRWMAGGRSNPINRAAEAIRRSANRWALVRHMIAVAVLADLEEAGTLAEWKVRQLWADADRQEAESIAAEQTERIEYDYDGQLSALYAADAKAATTTLRRMALALVCRRFGWDPRPTRKGA